MTDGQIDVRTGDQSGPAGLGFTITPDQIRHAEFNLVNSTATLAPERGSDLKKMAFSFAEVGFLDAGKRIATGDGDVAPGFTALRDWVVANKVRAEEYRVGVRGRTKSHRLV